MDEEVCEGLKEVDVGALCASSAGWDEGSALLRWRWGKEIIFRCKKMSMRIFSPRIPRKGHVLEVLNEARAIYNNFFCCRAEDITMRYHPSRH